MGLGCINTLILMLDAILGEFLIMLDVWCYLSDIREEVRRPFKFFNFLTDREQCYLLYSHYGIRQNPYSTLELLYVDFITS